MTIDHLDAELTLRDGLPHPDLAPFIDGRPDGLTLNERDGERVLRIPGRIEPTAGGRDRGGDLGPDALRHAPAGAAAG